MDDVLWNEVLQDKSLRRLHCPDFSSESDSDSGKSELDDEYYKNRLQMDVDFSNLFLVKAKTYSSAFSNDTSHKDEEYNVRMSIAESETADKKESAKSKRPFISKEKNINDDDKSGAAENTSSQVTDHHIPQSFAKENDMKYISPDPLKVKTGAKTKNKKTTPAKQKRLKSVENLSSANNKHIILTSCAELKHLITENMSENVVISNNRTEFLKELMNSRCRQENYVTHLDVEAPVSSLENSEEISSTALKSHLKNKKKRDKKRASKQKKIERRNVDTRNITLDDKNLEEINYLSTENHCTSKQSVIITELSDINETQYSPNTVMVQTENVILNMYPHFERQFVFLFGRHELQHYLYGFTNFNRFMNFRENYLNLPSDLSTLKECCYKFTGAPSCSTSICSNTKLKEREYLKTDKHYDRIVQTYQLHKEILTLAKHTSNHPNQYKYVTPAKCPVSVEHDSKNSFFEAQYISLFARHDLQHYMYHFEDFDCFMDFRDSYLSLPFTSFQTFNINYLSGLFTFGYNYLKSLVKLDALQEPCYKYDCLHCMSSSSTSTYSNTKPKQERHLETENQDDRILLLDKNICQLHVKLSESQKLFSKNLNEFEIVALAKCSDSVNDDTGSVNPAFEEHYISLFGSHDLQHYSYQFEDFNGFMDFRDYYLSLPITFIKAFYLTNNLPLLRQSEVYVSDIIITDIDSDTFQYIYCDDRFKDVVQHMIEQEASGAEREYNMRFIQGNMCLVLLGLVYLTREVFPLVKNAVARILNFAGILD